ncbi:MAG: RraA family protein [Candidatus Nealsonbacteria bacterium]|nr:MAG: RraA family protein [Candidatus Nealsonbacteria bacterium]
MGKVIYEIQRLPDSLIQKFKGSATGDLSDALDKAGNMNYRMKPIYPGINLIGSAVTVFCPVGDNLTIHKAIEVAQAGDVLVVNSGGYINAGLFGEIMSLACYHKGIRGLVIEGACRDSKKIREISFPVFSYGINPGGTVKESFGSINTSIQCGGVLVNPGDIIVGDDDGVVVVPKEKAEDVLKKVKVKEEKEEKIRELLAAGKSTMEIYGFSRILKEKGVIQ